VARVLICEDDDALRGTIEVALKERHTVVATGSGAEAIRLLDDDHYEVVITDILMPDIDGLEVIAQVRRTAPATKVLAISGGSLLLSSNYTLRTSRAIGAHAILEKPFRLANLSDAVERLLAERGDIREEAKPCPRT
jgi:DNA-binding NtrC family response regulator